ncbi:universal stress protein [Blastococcus sp. URHD0036]|uniref:universal stress protein n=1 Tax=Blastococcus sp. URHD0036 TaxID=1380356 RepID=UPI000690DBA8|nr:universal stress protein [Blastococcus sp. URHD0036]
MTLTTPTPTSAPAGGPDARPPLPSAVVVGSDGGACALEAVRWATTEAARRGVPLRIVHAAPHLRAAAPRGTPDLRAARRLTGTAYTVARHTDPSVVVTTEVVVDPPVTALLRAAEDAHLLVLGIATTGATDELVLAPVAQRVAAGSPCAVAVVPRQRSTPDPDRPLVAVLGLGSPVTTNRSPSRRPRRRCGCSGASRCCTRRAAGPAGAPTPTAGPSGTRPRTSRTPRCRG